MQEERSDSQGGFPMESNLPDNIPLPKFPQLLAIFQHHNQFVYRDWVPLEENFDLDEDQFDYDISAMDVDEASPIARIN